MAEDEEAATISPSLSQMKSAEAELKNECERMWIQVNKVHERVNKDASLGVLGETEQPMLKILQAKSKHLEAELHLLEAKQPQPLPTNPTILKALLQKELHKTNKELKELLEFIQSQRKELEEELEREKSVLEGYQQMKRTLEQNLESIDALEGNPRKSRSSQEKELHRQKKSAADQQQKLMRSLAAFVTKEFPKPNGNAQRTSGREQTSREYMSLLEILEILMNKCIDNKHDPYVTIDETSWPPYIELLLRCGIAVRHPQDCKRIRLVPFHL